MDIGVIAEHCNCTTHCQKGVEPMGDCICRLPGVTVTAHCEVEGGTTWHNNGSCVSCVRIARQARKDANAKRHAEIMAAPPRPTQIVVPEEEPDGGPEAPQSRRFYNEPPTQPVATLEIVLRVNGVDLTITRDLEKIQRILQVK